MGVFYNVQDLQGHNNRHIQRGEVKILYCTVTSQTQRSTQISVNTLLKSQQKLYELHTVFVVFLDEIRLTQLSIILCPSHVL